MPTSRRVITAATTIGLTSLALAGCSASSVAETRTSPDATIGAVDLSTDCPGNIVVQSNWNPEGEHGPLYEIIGPEPTIDDSNKLVRGPLYSQGEYTGVDVEVRAGGPAIGYQTVSSQLYTDSDIMLGYVEIDEAIQNSADLPTTSVFAQFEKGPAAIMWDPETYPGVESIAELAAAGAPALTYDGTNSTEWLMDSGLYPADLIDRSYDGTPANFVAAGGKSGQAGYATAEPYIYENDVESWNKPLDFQLYADAGWPGYSNTLSIRSGDLESYSSCLTKLVPVLQQAEIDYVADPEDTNTLLAELVEEYDTGWVYSKDVADYAASELRPLGLVGNGDNEYIGDIDETRVAETIDIMIPILDEAGTAPLEGLQPSDLYTNEFLDESIGFTD